ncbi:tyrosine-type recombinase/integrase [Kordiimonas aestuarii]|uniref:tyrosine-type recombinase/integrase n=1 Tax=Kordiimonas aestuarii TaxID=1005925 RepID=UPI0021D131C4|nr:tyrosine-type recombinase/integrase [Kordiimonas aestuarii]
MSAYRGFKPFDEAGNRTYLTTREREAFLEAAQNADPSVMTFCMILAYTGARPSEVSALTPSCVDLALQCIVIKCLKKRRKVVFRAVPVPYEVLMTLVRVHGITETEKRSDKRLWAWSRTTAWSRVAQVMQNAGLSGIGATSRGLRHTFAVSAVQCGVALNMVQKWMGHADIETTALYANATGAEELEIAKGMWRSFPLS